jgi:hypothetical protein
MWRVFAEAGLVLVLGGCAAAALPTVFIPSAVQIAQFGSTTFSEGTLETVFAQPFGNVTAAVRAMVAELDLKVRVDRPQGGFLYLELADQTGTSMTVRVTRNTASITSVEIRVGTFGNGPYSTALMGKIAERLAPPKPGPDEKPATAGPELKTSPPPTEP